MVYNLVNSAVILFAVVNPIGSLPIFLQLTQEMEKSERLRTFKVGVVVSLIILVSFIFLGKSLLAQVFQISIYDLMAAGGLLLLIIAVDHLVFGFLVRGVANRKEYQLNQIGAVPIACPILAGPGAMMTVLLISSEYGYLSALAAVVVVMAVTALMLRYIDVFYRILGKTVCVVLSKILCLFIAAIGISLLMRGLLFYFK